MMSRLGRLIRPRRARPYAAPPERRPAGWFARSSGAAGGHRPIRGLPRSPLRPPQVRALEPVLPHCQAAKSRRPAGRARCPRRRPSGRASVRSRSANRIEPDRGLMSWEIGTGASSCPRRWRRSEHDLSLLTSSTRPGGSGSDRSRREVLAPRGASRPAAEGTVPGIFLGRLVSGRPLPGHALGQGAVFGAARTAPEILPR